MTPLTVCCVLVQGEYPYTPEYVRRLLVMVRRHLARPFRFVCLTDQPDAMPPDVEAVHIKKIAGCFALWSKLLLFTADRYWTGRVLYLDLDTLVVDALDPIVDFPAALALTEDALVVERAHLATDRHGRRLVRKFNSSVMVWDAGTQSDLFTNLTPGDTQRLSTDQDWIAEQAPHAVAMNLDWFPRVSQLVSSPEFAATGAPMPPAAKVVLCKKPKNDQAITRWPWFDSIWAGGESAA